MKREREGDHSITMANYLMLLSRGDEFAVANSSNFNSRVFECKTCNRQFPSFQALGGHRASHKKLRLMRGEGESSDGQQGLLQGSFTKAKAHECSICGLEFAIGQALGGHMRRHRSAAHVSNSKAKMHTFMTTTTTTATTSSGSGCSTVDNNTNTSSANKNTERVLFPDLNLTPIENDLEFLKIGQSTPLVDCFNRSILALAI